MERILTAEQMKEVDHFNIEKLGISAEELVNRAGNAVAEEILKRFKGGRVLVCLGKGNNGADGAVIAKLLSAKHGFTVATLNVSNGIFKIFDKKFDIIVDCIFGTGLNREVEGKYKTAIEKINESGAYIISCDIASGLSGTTGKVMGVAVKANLTVAIQEYKLGHFLNEGFDYSGEVVAKDIGLSVWGDDYVKRISSFTVKDYFPSRKRNVNKGSFNKVGIIGGSADFVGSSLLSINALTAMKMGVGYSYLFVPKSLLNIYAGKNPECIVCGVNDENGQMVVDELAFSKALNLDAIAVGMGMGNTIKTYEVIKYFLTNYTGKLVIDADGLNALATFGIDILKDKKCQVVLTPHLKEYSRLTKAKIDAIMCDIIGNCKDFANDFNSVLLIKNAASVISNGTDTYINTTGTNGMAKAGSGDVLSGIIAGILARSENVLEGVAVACWLFGKAGETACQMQNEYTMTASDIIACLPKVINCLN